MDMRRVFLARLPWRWCRNAHATHGSVCGNVWGTFRCGDVRRVNRFGCFGRNGVRPLQLFRSRRLRRTEHVVYQAVFTRAERVEVEVGTLGIADDLPQRLTRSLGEDAIDLTLHLLETVQVLGCRGRRLPPRP